MQATPVSGPSSASASPPPLDLNGSQSAPAAQISFPDDSAVVNQAEGSSSGMSRPSTSVSDASIVYSVNKGQDALEVMGVPVRPITSLDDCWETVNNAQAVTPGWEKAFNMLRQRGRAASISVAHLARDHKLHQGPASPISYFEHSFGDLTEQS